MVFSLIKSNKTKDIETKFENFSNQLAQAFGQIKTDIESINSRLDSSQSEAERLGQWIGYLNRHAQRLSDSNSKILEKFEKIAENHHKLHTSHSQLAASHVEMVGKAQNLENGHERLSGALKGHQEALREHQEALRSELKCELQSRLESHREANDEEIRRLKAWIDYFSTHVDSHKGKEDALKREISKMETDWSEAYSKLRELVNGLRSENTELKGEIKSHMTDVRSELEHARDELKSTILELETTKSELSSAKQAIEKTASELESTKNLAQSIQKTAESERLVSNQPPQAPVVQPQTVVQPVFQEVSPSHSSFQKHIISRVMPNRKGYVLKFILDLIKENQHSTKEIEEIVVNEKQLCGRTSFYAYLKELKLKGRISYAEIDERQILVCTDSQTSLMDRLDRLQ